MNAMSRFANRAATFLLAAIVAGKSGAHEHDSYNHEWTNPHPVEHPNLNFSLWTAPNPVASNPNWMGKLSNTVRLNDLSLPGTHDTMAHSAKPSDVPLGAENMWRTQTMDLPQQLESGIRVLDIRLRHVMGNETKVRPRPHLICYHGRANLDLGFYQDTLSVKLGTKDRAYEFSDVLKHCQQFLFDHPSETILLKFKREGFAANEDNRPDEHFLDTFRENLRDARREFENLWWEETGARNRELIWQINDFDSNPDNDWEDYPGTTGAFGKKRPNPTLGDMRGKIVLLQDFDESISELNFLWPLHTDEIPVKGPASPDNRRRVTVYICLVGTDEPKMHIRLVDDRGEVFIDRSEQELYDIQSRATIERQGNLLQFLNNLRVRLEVDKPWLTEVDLTKNERKDYLAKLRLLGFHLDYGISRNGMNVQSTAFLKDRSGAELYRKWTAVKTHLEEAAEPDRSGELFLNFFNSATHPDWVPQVSKYQRIYPFRVASGHVTPGTGAARKVGDRVTFDSDKQPDFPRANCGEKRCDILHEGINGLATNYWRQDLPNDVIPPSGAEPKGRAGMILCDFPGAGLIEEVIKLNAGAEARRYTLEAKTGEAIDFRIPRQSNELLFDLVGEWPAGLSINSREEGHIVGVVSQPGPYYLGFTARKPGEGIKFHGVVTLTVTDAYYPFAGPLFATGGRGVPFSYQVSFSPRAEGKIQEHMDSLHLPPGLTLHEGGLITGTPTESGSFDPWLAGRFKDNSELFGAHLDLYIHEPVVKTAYRGIPYSFLTVHPSWIDDPTRFTATNLPPGFEIGETTGIIFGTPTTLGTTDSPTVVTASQEGAPDRVTYWQIKIEQVGPPVITSALTATAEAGELFTYQIEATNHPYRYDVAGPSWLSVDSGSDILSGTPPAEGVYEIELKATNVEASSTAVLTLTVELPNRVSNLEDSGPGSLRQVLAEVPLGGLIAFAPELAGETIVLSSGALNIDKGLSIDATALPGGITISGGGNSRVFEITSETNEEVYLRGLQISRGRVSGNGGGIYHTGTSRLQLEECTFSDNRAQAQGHGGAICIGDTPNSDTWVEVYRCTFVRNRAYAKGGAIRNFGRLGVRLSTFSGNTSVTTGGAVCHDGGLDLRMLNCTLVSNATNKGGGISIDSASFSQVISNNIIAGNFAEVGPDLFVPSSSRRINYGEMNLFGTLAGIASERRPSPGTVVVGDPLLGPLADNGGRTMTMLPKPESSALDIASRSSGNQIDQRGFPRSIGIGPDLGAVELGADIERFWSMDPDSDGTPFGVEFATGMNPFGAELFPLLRPQPYSENGDLGFSTGIDPDAVSSTTWIIYQSTTMEPDSWEEIYRFNGPMDQETISSDYEIRRFDGLIRLVNLVEPRPAQMFYQLKVELAQ